MALTLVRKGTWNSLYVISDSIIATLGRNVEKSKKGTHLNITTGTQVTLTDRYIRREHQYRPEMGPKRFSFKIERNPPDSTVSIAVTPKVDISTALQDPYIVIDSLSLGEKTLVFLHEGAQALEDNLLRLIQASEEKYASENKGEAKSDCTLEFVFPRLAIYLKATKPHKVDRHTLESEPRVSFVTEVMVGARMHGKLQRVATVLDPPAEKKKSKKKRDADKPPPPLISWEVKAALGCSLPPEQTTNVEISKLWETLDTLRIEPTKWEAIWIRSQTAEEYLCSLPETEEYPALLNAGRFTISPCPSLNDAAVLADSGIPRLISACPLLGQQTGTVGNFYFASRARGVAVVQHATEAGENIASRFTSEAASCAFLGMAGYAAGITCTQGHCAVPEKPVSSSRCSRCDLRPSSLGFKCGVCDEHGAVCSVCGIAGLAFCPRKHALQIRPAEGHLQCDGCDARGREISFVCPLGCHYRKSYCGTCASDHILPFMLRALEPSPFEHCMSVTGRVKLMHSTAEDGEAFAAKQLPGLVGVKGGLTVSTVYGNQDGFAEFRFTLQREDPDGVSPYKRVIDFMLRTLESGEAIVDIVEINSVRVNDPDNPANNSAAEEWLKRLN